MRYKLFCIRKFGERSVMECFLQFRNIAVLFLKPDILLPLFQGGAFASAEILQECIDDLFVDIHGANVFVRIARERDVEIAIKVAPLRDAGAGENRQFVSGNSERVFPRF